MMRTRWIASAIAALTLSALTAPSTVLAQGSPRDRRAPAPAGAGPTEPPPPPRAEKREAARAGFVWIEGEWDWRGNKWEWVPGHWERARANKQWRPGKWEQRNGTWTKTPGRWEAGTTPPAPTPGQAGGNSNDGPREAPPPPKKEQREAARAGFVWVDGEWDWRNGKWEWVAGHWERERAGKRWRPSRWDQRDGRWVRTPGAWEDGGPVVADGPREAPPPPKKEQREAARAGFVWVDGEWDWRNGKWEWVAGHWERERAGKRWRPSRWEQRDGRWIRTPGDWEDGGPIADGPREAPPPPKKEQREAARAGFVWVDGEWDWKNGKWEWVAGHWERERAGKRWRPSRWEQRDGRWIRTAGDWEDFTAGPANRPGPREWRIERPVVSNYWPAKGKPGTVITIRGRNFPTNTTVLWGGKEVRGVKVTPTSVKVSVPSDAMSSSIAIRAGNGRPLAVGPFEVVDGYDPVAEQRRLEEEARKRAEAAWAARQRELAKDRAAREAAAEARRREREASREQRRAERAREIRARYAAAFLADPNTQDELTLHAQRIAELERMAEVAEIKGDAKLVVRISVLREREDARHDQRMVALDAAFRAGGSL